jgi:hypothetical protein
MRRGIPLPRTGPALAPEPSADEMMLGEKPLEILMSDSDVAHI